MQACWPDLAHSLPPEIIFLADPEGAIMGSSLGPTYSGGNGGPGEMRLVGALREVLQMPIKMSFFCCWNFLAKIYVLGCFGKD